MTDGPEAVTVGSMLQKLRPGLVCPATTTLTDAADVMIGKGRTSVLIRDDESGTTLGVITVNDLLVAFVEGVGWEANVAKWWLMKTQHQKKKRMPLRTHMHSREVEAFRAEGYCFQEPTFREEEQHKHKFCGPDFPLTFLTLTRGCPAVKKLLPTTGAAEKYTFWQRRPWFLVRASMTRRVLEESYTKNVCVDFLAHIS